MSMALALSTLLITTKQRFLLNCPKASRYFVLSKKMSSESCIVAVCQLTSTNNKESNLNSVKKLVSEAAQKSAKVIFLPEACDYVGSNKEETNLLAETLDGPLICAYRSLAKSHDVWLSIGGFHEIVQIDSKVKLNNCHVVINNLGEIQSVYRKLHLFDVTLPEKNVYLKESDNVQPGQCILPPVDTPAGALGLSIVMCYDLRFPELSILLRKQGAEILTFPSAFTNSTGKAHWEVLLRSRAIENQCYVIAAAQYGKHNCSRISYGHSLIIDPWGNVIGECPKYTEGKENDESFAVATITKNFIEKVRRDMPVFQHRRNDIYQLSSLEESKTSSNEAQFFKFAEKIIPATTVFYSTKYSYAFTNIRCVVPGHVLVASIREARRLENLLPEEVADLFQTVVKVQKIMESVHGSQSSTICVQDGQLAGQTVQHVHCHILPRKESDFARNDDIYQELAKHDRDENPGPVRSADEMNAEADLLRNYFS